MSSRSSSRSSARTRGSGVLLDPYGIYGTRTANRMRAARRRRQTQNVILVLLLVTIIAGSVALAKHYRIAAVKPSAEYELLSSVVTPPLLTRTENAPQEVIIIASADGRLLRFDAGSDKQDAPHVILDTAFPLHTPLLENHLAFVPCEDGVLYAVDWQAGKVLWRYDFHAPLSARPAWARITTKGAPDAPVKTSREVVIGAADDGLIVALDVKTGRPLWRTRVPAPPGDALVVTEGTLPRVLVPLLGAATARGGLWCLDAGSGKVLWRFPKVGHEKAIQLAPPVVDENANRVFFAGEMGAVFCLLDLERGTYDAKKRIGWKSFVAPLPEDFEDAISWRAAPLLFFGGERPSASSRLVVGGSDGGVRCFASRSGALLWQFAANAPIAALQKVERDGRDAILVGTRGAALFLIDAKTGAPLQHFVGRGLIAGVVISGNQVLAVNTDGLVQRFLL